MDWNELSGLRPRAMCLVGEGYSREALKQCLIQRNIAWVSQAVMTPEACALRILGLPESALASKATRLDCLDLLLEVPDLGFPHLRSLRAKPGGLERLEKALDQGPMVFWDAVERDAMEESLQRASWERRQMRKECTDFYPIYSAFLDSKGLLDRAALFTRAREKLEHSWPAHFQKPEKCILLMGTMESRVRQFLDVLLMDISWQTPEPKRGFECKLRGMSAVEDGIESALEVATAEDVFVIPDDPRARGALELAAKARGWCFEEKRDPVAWKLHEGFKEKCLEIETILSGFPANKLRFWLLTLKNKDALKWVQDLAASGALTGLSKKAPRDLRHFLAPFQKRFEARGSLKAFLDAAGLRGLGAEMDIFIQNWEQSFPLEVEAPMTLWFRALKRRLQVAPPPISGLRFLGGAKVYRFSEWPLLEDVRNIWLIDAQRGMQTRRVGDDWWQEQERLTLSTSFHLKTTQTEDLQQRARLQAWLAVAPATAFVAADQLDSFQERMHFIKFQPEGSTLSPRIQNAFTARVEARPQKIEIPTQSQALSITLLDQAAQCQFFALSSQWWKLRSLRRAASFAPWPEREGQLLHACLAQKLKGEPFTLSSEGTGLWDYPLLRHSVERRYKDILESFTETEDVFQSHSGAEPWKLDDTTLEWPFYGVWLKGRPDRIDRWRGPDQRTYLLIHDYKGASFQCSGLDLLEEGHGLQLGLYALGAIEKWQMPIGMLSWIPLSKHIRRSHGLFFENLHGKEPGQLPSIRKNVKGLVGLSPEEAWTRIETLARETLEAWHSGVKESRPRTKLKQCDTCTYKLFCQVDRRRLGQRGGHV